MKQLRPINKVYVADDNDSHDDTTDSEQEERKITFERLSDFEKGEIFAMYSHNYSTSEIAAWIKCSWSTVDRWIKRWQKEGNFDTKAVTGRPRKTLPGEDRLIKILSLQDPNLTAVDIAPYITDDPGDDGKGKSKVTAETIRRRLRSYGLFARRRWKKPLLSKQNKKARLQWAQAHKDWTVEDWAKVLWTDESPFTLFPGREGYIRRRNGEGGKEKHLNPTVKHGGGSIMVWGCFHSSGVGVLKRVEGRIDAEVYKQILIHQAMPELKKLISVEPEYVRWTFQQDNASPHRANIVQKYLENKQSEWGGRLQVMTWPSQSPDLNPIENVWAYVKKQLRKRPKKPSSHANLLEQVQEIWKGLPSRILINLVESMPKRAAMVIKARGGTIKY